MIIIVSISAAVLNRYRALVLYVQGLESSHKLIIALLWTLSTGHQVWPKLNTLRTFINSVRVLHVQAGAELAGQNLNARVVSSSLVKKAIMTSHNIVLTVLLLIAAVITFLDSVAFPHFRMLPLQQASSF